MAEHQIPLSALSPGIGATSAPRDTVARNPTATGKSGKRVGISTLGCKINSFESELISQSLRNQDWYTVSDREAADLYLINTCTVTREADRQARQAVRRVIRQNPEALVVVTGCYAQMAPEACAAIEGVDLVLGNDRKLDVHNLLPQLEQGTLPQVLVGDVDQHVSLPDQLLAGYEGRTRAFIQVQQGCDNGCTFCIIHKARGHSRSLPPTLVRRQVQKLVAAGYHEIVVCGVDLGSYGEDFDQPFDLCDLLESLLEDVGDARIRLSSIDPAHISDRLIGLMVSHEAFCHQMHISLQSGSTLILKRMKRRYSAEQAAERLKAVRAAIPDMVFSADILVGFPTETIEAFEATRSLVKDLGIVYPHVFPYSDRDGTPAARIPAARKIDSAEVKRRAREMRETGHGLLLEKAEAMRGTSAWMFCRKKDLNGHSPGQQLYAGQTELQPKRGETQGWVKSAYYRGIRTVS